MRRMLDAWPTAEPVVPRMGVPLRRPRRATSSEAGDSPKRPRSPGYGHDSSFDGQWAWLLAGLGRCALVRVGLVLGLGLVILPDLPDTEDEVGDLLGGFVLDGGDGVGVDVHRERSRGVTEPIGHDLDRHAGLEAERGVGVAEVVQPDLRETEPLHGPVVPRRRTAADPGKIAVVRSSHLCDTPSCGWRRAA